MANVVDITRSKVQKYLTDMLGSVTIDKDGDFTIQQGSTMVFIRVVPWRDGESAVVSVFAPVLLEVQPSPALHQYIAENDYVFGNLTLEAGEHGTQTLMFGHRLLGDFLDPAELESAVGAVAFTADDLDDELQPRFGGSKMLED